MARGVLFQRTVKPLVPLLIAVIVGLGCAGQLQHGVYARGDVRYRIGELGPAWQRVTLAGNDLAFVARASGHSMAINSTCVDHDDPPLEVLTRHLLMGFAQRNTVTQQPVTLDGRAALRSHVTATLDGVEVELELVVMKKNGCVYDFTYLSPVGHQSEELAAFDQVLTNFHTEAPQ